MNLPPRALNLVPLSIKEKLCLAVDTGFKADSLEGLRLVKASRGSGWFYQNGQLRPWITKGVLQEQTRLMIWGDLDALPDGRVPESWPLSGPEGLGFVRALVDAWICRSGVAEPLPRFTSSALIPWQTAEGWAFAFLPPELRGVLDSLLPLSDRLPWEHLRHPELEGSASWAFTSAALALQNATGCLPWEQENEEALRHEIRELKRTFQEAELPPGLEPGVRALFYEALTGRFGSKTVTGWQTWARSTDPLPSLPGAPEGLHRQATLKRQQRRSRLAFWGKQGTKLIAGSLAAVLVLAVVGMVTWGAIKPDPTDLWTPTQVVTGYYDALSRLDADRMKLLVRPAAGKDNMLERDQDEASNLYVIRQVRIAYEHQSPVITPQEWSDLGRPALKLGQILYGFLDLQTSNQGDDWTVTYQKWVSDSQENGSVVAQGNQVIDRLRLISTDRGWKISVLRRERQPLP